MKIELTEEEYLKIRLDCISTLANLAPCNDPIAANIKRICGSILCKLEGKRGFLPDEDS